MVKGHRKVSTASWILVATLAIPAAVANAQEKESFRATGVSSGRLPPGKTLSFTITIDKWTPLEERQRLVQLLKEKGDEAVKEELEKQKAGYLVPPSWGKWPSWKIDVASQTELPDGGRVIRAFTERPIALFEAYYSTRSMANEFGALEMKFDKDGKGVEGWLIPAARIDFDDEGKVRFSTVDFSTGPMKLIGISSFTKKKK